jgi:hypothetical protein
MGIVQSITDIQRRRLIYDMILSFDIIATIRAGVPILAAILFASASAGQLSSFLHAKGPIF